MIKKHDQRQCKEVILAYDPVKRTGVYHCGKTWNGHMNKRLADFHPHIGSRERERGGKGGKEREVR